jgi:hypothetical protein
MSFIRVLPAIVVVLSLLTGCGALRNTPQQEAVYAAHAACQASGRVDLNVTLVRVEPDGRFWYETRGGQAGRAAFEVCMQEQFAKQRRSER